MNLTWLIPAKGKVESTSLRVYTSFHERTLPKSGVLFHCYFSFNPANLQPIFKIYCTMITIRVNNQILDIQQDFNLLQLLEHLHITQDGIAVAVNNTIILKNLWVAKTFSENDSILIIQATQGG